MEGPGRVFGVVSNILIPCQRRARTRLFQFHDELYVLHNENNVHSHKIFLDSCNPATMDVSANMRS